MAEDLKNKNESGWNVSDEEKKSGLQIYLSKVSRWGMRGFYVYQYLSMDSEIALSVSAPKETMTGVPFDIAINFNNNSKNVLRDATLSVFLPENASVLGDNSNKR